MAFSDFYASYHKAHVYIATVLCCVGLLTNASLFYILTRRRMQSIVNTLMTAIAACDSVVMVSYSIYLWHFEWGKSTECWTATYTYGWAVFIAIHANLSVIFRACSLWLTAVMAAYRFYVTRKPYNAYRRSICEEREAQRI